VGGGHIGGLVLVAVVNVEVGVVARRASLPSTTLRVRVLMVSAKLGGSAHLSWPSLLTWAVYVIHSWNLEKFRSVVITNHKTSKFLPRLCNNEMKV